MMDIVCNEKCRDCGAPMIYKELDIVGKKKNILICSADCQKIRDLQKARIQQIKQLRSRYNDLGFITRKRLKNYNEIYKEEAEKIINSFSVKRSQVLFFIGEKEQEKTTLTEVIAKEILAKDLVVLKMSMLEYNSMLLQAYSSRGELLPEGLISKWLKADLIIITHLGLGAQSAIDLKNMFRLFSGLIENRKSFIVTARPEDIEKLKKNPEMKSIFDLLSDKAKVLTFK